MRDLVCVIFGFCLGLAVASVKSDGPPGVRKFNVGWLMVTLYLGILIFAGCSSQIPAPIAEARIATIMPHPIYGQDTLAINLKAFNQKNLAEQNPKSGAFTVLATTFGADPSAFRSILKSNSPAYAEIKIINGSCHSDGNCGSYEYAAKSNMAALCGLAGKKDAGFKKSYQSTVSLYKDACAQFPATKCIVSPINEHGCSKQQYQVLANWTLQVWPAVQLANSPLGGISVEAYKGAWIERHGNKNISGADIVSLDGVDASQIDFQKFLRDTAKAKIVYVWGSPYNCRLAGWQDPRARTACPTQSVFQLYAHITDPIPAAPKFTGTQCKKIIPFAAPNIWKPMADYAPNDSRTWLPVLITKLLAPNAPINVLAANGKSVGSLGYYDTYLDQGWRWYAGYKGGTSQSGYQLQHAAQLIAGSPYVFLQDGSTCLGPLPPGERWGQFD